ncbi:aldehyde dehydrogenase family protein [Microbacterium sp. X-17]|uniref:aldehyde dehydrogenase family protein n=1 Tax=Microbacterium sp. X-17 TaxID=3144404 RepID=UPI0031F5D5C1
MKRESIMIGNEWVPSTNAETIGVVNPATEEEIARIPAGGSADVDRAVDAARAAFDGWSQTSVEERATLLLRLADILEERSDELTRTMVGEIGEPITLAAIHQTAAPIAHLRNTVAALREVEFDQRIDDTLVHRAPAGVVGAITPWNVPLLMIAMKVGAATAAGCTVVLKGTEIAPLSSFLFAEAAIEAGFPAGVINLVSGTGPVVGEALVAHGGIDVVSLTGSVRAGRRVMEVASQGIKRVSLELGGKSANVILDGADLDLAVTTGVKDAFRNSGQVCGGLTRVLVPASRLREAEDAAVAVAQSYVIGDPYDAGTTLGPVATHDQHVRVRSLIRSGINEGARLLTGGDEAPDGLDRGYYVRPTVFTGSNDLTIAQEEIFGPVVTIIPFRDEEDAVRIANDSKYGLAGAVWAGDDDHARTVAKRLRTGRVRINGSPINPRAPHGGFKLSGLGRENGVYGIEEFLEYQSIG